MNLDGARGSSWDVEWQCECLVAGFVKRKLLNSLMVGRMRDGRREAMAAGDIKLVTMLIGSWELVSSVSSLSYVGG